MNNNHLYIINLCQQLVKEGKTPTVAMVRNRAAHSLGIPEVIKALQSWQQSPKQQMPPADATQPHDSKSAAGLEQRICILEQQVLKLTAALDAALSKKPQ